MATYTIKQEPAWPHVNVKANHPKSKFKVHIFDEAEQKRYDFYIIYTSWDDELIDKLVMVEGYGKDDITEASPIVLFDQLPVTIRSTILNFLLERP